MSGPPMGRPGGLPRAKRSLGQNFLINPGVRDKIISALEPTPSHWAVEIGPGPGALTGPLTGRCAHVVAVEMDRSLAEALPQVVDRPEVLEVIVADGATCRSTPPPPFCVRPLIRGRIWSDWCSCSNARWRSGYAQILDPVTMDCFQ